MRAAATVNSSGVVTAVSFQEPQSSAIKLPALAALQLLLQLLQLTVLPASIVAPEYRTECRLLPDINRAGTRRHLEQQQYRRSNYRMHCNGTNIWQYTGHSYHHLYHKQQLRHAASATQSGNCEQCLLHCSIYLYHSR